VEMTRDRYVGIGTCMTAADLGVRKSRHTTWRLFVCTILSGKQEYGYTLCILLLLRS
jgi:hypothetical protein